MKFRQAGGQSVWRGHLPVPLIGVKTAPARVRFTSYPFAADSRRKPVRGSPRLTRLNGLQAEAI
ncbi:hypothetical protein D4Q71_11080 [Rhodopseudomonas palustris]|nr:hypothetical protein B1S06_12780 [Rhodopseudomonas palustris]PPQ42710.1 hypothetical protein CKO39_16225 [Rhodopseudomonas palustris]RJF64671.1 hypothetical protein D4Q71_11080 [Rhodopseudomonas palustris]